MDNSTVEIIGRDGRRRRMRKGECLKDGETMSIPHGMAFFDGREVADYLAAKYTVHVVDGAGSPAGHRPDFIYDAAHDRLQDAAAVAYAERSERMSNMWRTRDEQTGSDTEQTVADAYEAKRRRLADAWRH